MLVNVEGIQLRSIMVIEWGYLKEKQMFSRDSLSAKHKYDLQACH